MVDFNGFDKGVIGKRLPADTTLNCMRKAELINLLHLAEDNHRVLAEAYKIAVDTSKCNICTLHLDSRKVEDIKADAIRKFAEWCKNNNVQCRKKLDGEWIQFSVSDIVSEYEKEQKEGAEND